MIQWRDVSVGVSDAESAEVAALLQTQAAGGTVIEETREGTVVRAYFPLEASPELGAGALSTLAHRFPHLRPLDRPLMEKEWMQGWRSFFPPVPVGERLLILPPWEHRRPPEARVAVVIDPGPAFGTGHHPTTQMCLEAMERNLRPGMRVLDLGTGSGILAIAAALLGAEKVVALDTDWVATKAARDNARANRVLGRVSMLTGSLNGRLKAFDLLLANISSQTVIEVAHPLAHAARPGAVLAASGFLANSLSAVEHALGEAGWQPMDVLTSDEWRTLVVGRI